MTAASGQLASWQAGHRARTIFASGSGVLDRTCSVPAYRHARDHAVPSACQLASWPVGRLADRGLPC
jgi:hypothetical protein